MNLRTRLKEKLPSPVSLLSAVFAAALLVLSFPDFELWPLAWVALAPLLFAVNREKDSLFRSAAVGWTFGVAFFFGSCWWLTHAPVTYAGFPPLLAYFLLFCAASVVALFPALFAFLFAFLLGRVGNYAIFSAPFLWTAVEFLRFWTTGNNWNAVAYSQAFQPALLTTASIGGIYLTGFLILLFNAGAAFQLCHKPKAKNSLRVGNWLGFIFIIPAVFFPLSLPHNTGGQDPKSPQSSVIAIQPNVPMSGLTEEKWRHLRQKHVELSETALRKLDAEQRTTNDERRATNNERPTTVIFPESPMNFMYERDAEFQSFVGDFARRHNVSVLFNAAEPDEENRMFFNSAVMVNSEGRKIAQYDKIYLVPFGESVPAPLQNIVPALVGSFSYGKEYDLLPFGDAQGGVMICFESHFPTLSREYVRRGADVLIEMTNDGYLGNTPVLRQHLANAVFRAVETNRPVVRVTNVGITAYITERGEVTDAAGVYEEATRAWQVSRSNREQTFYVKYGDWFAWLCALASLGLIVWAVVLTRRRNDAKAQREI